MSAVQTTPLKSSARTIPVVELATLGFVVALCAFTFWLARPLAVVPRVEVVNPSPAAIEVSVAGASRDDVLGLAVALPHRMTRVNDVIDQGDRWVFGFRTASCPRVDVEVSRRSLETAGWRIVIPPGVVASLARECVHRSPVATVG